MRNIKFKVWDVDQKRMYNDSFRLRKEGFEIWNKLDKESSKNLIWLQFTGLKDENGIEVYEGDSIVLKDSENGFMYGSGNVTFNKGCFYVNDMILYDFIDEDLILEIIGNIYENPDLIKQQ